jgi:undecaprenyl-diphosphatase
MRTVFTTPLTWVWVTALSGLAGFLAMTEIIESESIVESERHVLLALRDPENLSDPWGPAWFEEIAAEISALGGYTILVTIVALVLVTLLLLRKRAAALFLFAALATGTVLSQGLKFYFSRPRPDLVDHLDRTFTSSFPSGHASASMMAYLTLAAVAIRFIPRHSVRLFLLWAAFILAILIGVSRVYLGVHWPTDVLAGWFLGIAWASLCWLAAHYLSGGRTLRDELGHSRA